MTDERLEEIRRGLFWRVWDIPAFPKRREAMALADELIAENRRLREAVREVIEWLSGVAADEESAYAEVVAELAAMLRDAVDAQSSP